MFDKYGVELEEGNQVIVSSTDKRQQTYFVKCRILEIEYCDYLDSFLALVDHEDGDWVSSENVIFLQGV